MGRKALWGVKMGVLHPFLSGVDERHLPKGGLWDENEGGFGRTRRRKGSQAM